MTDNLTITRGSGTTIATDQVGTIHYQRVKLVDGTTDATTIIAAGGGVEANALRVTIANDSSLPTGANTIGKLAANSGVDIGDVDITSAVNNTNIAITDTITSDEDTVVIDTNGASRVAIKITGTWSASLLFEVTLDGTNWDNIEAVDVPSYGYSYSTGSNGMYSLNVGGYKQFRVRADTYASGTATITMEASQGGGLVEHARMYTFAENSDLADGISNRVSLPMNEKNDGVVKQQVFPMNYNGSTWDRVRGDSTNGLLVNLGGNNDVTVTGTVTANAGTNLNTSALATSAKQLADGHNVTVDNAAGSAVYVRPGTSAVFTVDLAGNNDVTTTAQIPGVGATNLGKAEDAGHTTGDTGIFMLAVRNDSDVALTSTNLDYSPIAVTASGKVVVAANGMIAHDTADTVNPVKVGGHAYTTEPAAVDDDDIVNAYFDEYGYQYMKLGAETSAIGRVGHDITGMADGVTTVTTAGTDVALAGSTACKRVIIQAQTDNTNIIAVGTTGVDATVATGTGVVLYPGDAIDFEIDNLADIYIDSLVNGEGVRYTVFT